MNERIMPYGFWVARGRNSQRTDKSDDSNVLWPYAGRASLPFITVQKVRYKYKYL